jgi:CheY-like chemotaxis protein
MVRKRLLIVEKNQALRKLFYQEMRKEDYYVRTAYDANGCLKQMGVIEIRDKVRVTHNFDLICLDTGIEDDDVASFCKTIKDRGIGLLLLIGDPYPAGDLMERRLIDGYTDKKLGNIKAAVKNYFDYVYPSQ